MASGWHGRLPSLGPRGEGWVAGQAILLTAILVVGVTAGSSWDGWPAALTAIAGLALTVGAAALLLRGLLDLGGSLTPWPRPRAGSELVVTGAYALVRHPLYGGLVLGALGWSLLMASLAGLGLAVALTAFLDLKARREEGWLAERYPGYAAYATSTRRLIPWVY
ncbi:isoprenylcysteine carboxylmethyltransferase family protein [soil metagenome]